jgi:hypothetical protein
MLPDDSTMPRPAPSAQQQLDFLAKIERLLAEGRKTTTYKFALLIALTNVAVEKGDDSGDPLDIDIDDVARQFLSLYWNMARPYPALAKVLEQSTNAARPARMITLLVNEAHLTKSSYQRLRVYRSRRDELLAEAKATLKKDVLHRLQTAGDSGKPDPELGRFLYEHPRTQTESRRTTHITLNPGVSACLRQLRGVIISMAEARWARWVRENNQSLGADCKLEDFLFTPERIDVRVHAERFYRIQDQRCFYTGDRLKDLDAGEVDHFIPWARYPFDSPFNLVLASRKVNNSLRDSLKPAEWRTRWLARNDEFTSVLTAPAPNGFGASHEDAATARAISDWLYRSAQAG